VVSASNSLYHYSIVPDLPVGGYFIFWRIVKAGDRAAEIFCTDQKFIDARRVIQARVAFLVSFNYTENLAH